MGVILYILSLILVYILSVPFILYSVLRMSTFKEAGDYFFFLAQSIDQFGNAMGKYLFNDLFVRTGGHLYGNVDETISSVTGRNFKLGKLTRSGMIFRILLDKTFGKDHCVNSIGA